MTTGLPARPRGGHGTEAPGEDLRARRRRLLQDDLAGIAVELFLARGYDAVSVDDIAAAAKMSQRSFFRYFATKDEVLRRYWRSMTEALVAAFRERPDSEDVDVAIRAALRVTSHVSPAHRPRVHALGGLFLQTPEVWARMLGDSFLDDGVAREFGRRTGADPDGVECAARAAAVNGAAAAGWTAWLRSPGDEDPADFIAQAVDLACVLGPKAGPRPR